MKYIRTNQNSIIIFSETLNHSDIRGFEGKPVSAGFVHLHDNELLVRGESFTLNLKSLPEDKAIIARQLHLY